LIRALRFGLGEVFAYQLTLRHRFEHRRNVRIGLKDFLKGA
jgi:hypothetical protein